MIELSPNVQHIQENSRVSTLPIFCYIGYKGLQLLVSANLSNTVPYLLMYACCTCQCGREFNWLQALGYLLGDEDSQFSSADYSPNHRLPLVHGELGMYAFRFLCSTVVILKVWI